VEGAGVVGEQPMLCPGQVHEYRSFCVLKSTDGYMEGHYRFVRVDGSSFDAEIPRFLLHASCPPAAPRDRRAGRGPAIARAELRCSGRRARRSAARVRDERVERATYERRATRVGREHVADDQREQRGERRLGHRVQATSSLAGIAVVGVADAGRRLRTSCASGPSTASRASSRPAPVTARGERAVRGAEGARALQRVERGGGLLPLGGRSAAKRWRKRRTLAPLGP
jgi:hypothetical protein